MDSEDFSASRESVEASSGNVEAVGEGHCQSQGAGSIGGENHGGQSGGDFSGPFVSLTHGRH